MKKIYIVLMEEDNEEWYDNYAYADKEKAEARLNELMNSNAAWYYDIDEFDFRD